MSFDSRLTFLRLRGPAGLAALACSSALVGLLSAPASLCAQTPPPDAAPVLRDVDPPTTLEPLPDATAPPTQPSASAPDDAGRSARIDQGSANYGRPRPLVIGKKAKPKTTGRPLPPLVPYPTSAEARRQQRARTPDGYAPPPPPSPTTAQLPSIERRTPKRPDEQPFDPVGLDVGLLRVKPYFESDVGYDDNPDRVPKGSSLLRGSSFLYEEGGADFASDWSRHSLIGSLRLGYYDYFENSNADRPTGGGKFTSRIDVTRDTKINIDGQFNLDTQNPTSPNITPGVATATLRGRPLIYSFGGGLGVQQNFNRLEMSLRGSVDRFGNQDATFSDGSVQDLSHYNYNAYGLTGRAAYEMTPGVKPFIEATVDQRVHDFEVDPLGNLRNSTGADAKIGSTFELTRLITGSIAGGYADRHYQDARLKDLRGATFDSSLVYTATPLTTVTLRGTTTLDETTVAGASGTITRKASLEVGHALLRNLTITGLASYVDANYVGGNLDQRTMDLGLRVEYNLTRSVVIKGSFTHERLLSNASGSDYTANVIMIGLKLQR